MANDQRACARNSAHLKSSAYATGVNNISLFVKHSVGLMLFLSSSSSSAFLFCFFHRERDKSGFMCLCMLFFFIVCVCGMLVFVR